MHRDTFKAFLAVFGMACALTLAINADRVAHAFSGPTKYAQAFTIDCSSGGTDGGTNQAVEIASTNGGGHLSLRCDNPSTDIVYLGDHDVEADGTSGYPICTTTTSCSDSALTVDSRALYCASAAAVTLRCIVLTNNQI